MKNLVSRFVTEETGVTAIEYGLIAGLVAVVIITSLTTLGGQLQAVYVLWSTAVTGAM